MEQTATSSYKASSDDQVVRRHGDQIKKRMVSPENSMKTRDGQDLGMAHVSPTVMVQRMDP